MRAKRLLWRVALYAYSYAAVSLCVALILSVFPLDKFPFWQAWLTAAGVIAAVVAVLTVAGGTLFALAWTAEYLHNKAFGRGEG